MKRILLAVLLALPLAGFSEGNTNDNKSGEKFNETSKDSLEREPVTVFQGTIGDVRNYEPLSDVEITVTRKDKKITKRVKTDEEGKFAITGLPDGIYKVRFEKKGYEPGNYESLSVSGNYNKNFGFLLFKE